MVAVRLRVRLVLVGLVFTFPLSMGSAWSQSSRNEKDKIQKAKERCKAQRGTNCDTPEGLNEWMLQERSRQEAIRDGSRHRPAPPK